MASSLGATFGVAALISVTIFIPKQKKAAASATQGRPTVYAGAVGRGYAPDDLQKNARHCRAFPLR